MENKDKAKAVHGGAPRKSKRAPRADEVDVDELSEIWDSVGHLFTPIPDADIKGAELREKKCQKR